MVGGTSQPPSTPTGPSPPDQPWEEIGKNGKKISHPGSTSPSYSRPAASSRSATPFKETLFRSTDARPLYRDPSTHPHASPTLRGEKKGFSTGARNVKFNPRHNKAIEAHAASGAGASASQNEIALASSAVVEVKVEVKERPR